MVGFVVWRNLEKKEYFNLIGKSSATLDLRYKKAILDFLEEKNWMQLLELEGFW